MQLLSPPLRLDPGFVIHFSKHFPLMVCTKMKKYSKNKVNKEKYNLTRKKT
jgi:hypothetical protein